MAKKFSIYENRGIIFSAMPHQIRRFLHAPSYKFFLFFLYHIKINRIFVQLISFDYGFEFSEKSSHHTEV